MSVRYTPSDEDLLHGWYGNEVLVNFTPRPFLDVAPRRYRFRVLNASNARIYRLALRRDDGTPMPFDLIGTDGGLLEHAIRVEETFLATAERIDILVDFSNVANGGIALLESRAFDPMHAEEFESEVQESLARLGGVSIVPAVASDPVAELGAPVLALDHETDCADQLAGFCLDDRKSGVGAVGRTF